ncbi:MAG: MotA/TolQ/ExbB proton channel family protein, partial [Pirellulaceae bacterium]|nr:MotA/TolQ/ExbB proton channel family protein [Pirellulaceae bacterium]
LLLGIFGTIQGFISSYMVIATAGSTPKPSDMATGISAGLFASLVGLMATFPGYFVVAIGLFIRTLQARSSPPAEYQDS